MKGKDITIGRMYVWSPHPAWEPEWSSSTPVLVLKVEGSRAQILKPWGGTQLGARIERITAAAEYSLNNSDPYWDIHVDRIASYVDEHIARHGYHEWLALTVRRPTTTLTWVPLNQIRCDHATWQHAVRAEQNRLDLFWRHQREAERIRDLEAEQRKQERAALVEQHRPVQQNTEAVLSYIEYRLHSLGVRSRILDYSIDDAINDHPIRIVLDNRESAQELMGILKRAVS